MAETQADTIKDFEGLAWGGGVSPRIKRLRPAIFIFVLYTVSPGSLNVMEIPTVIIKIWPK